MKSIFHLFQEKEAYRWAIKETIKSMLAFGWTIERAKEGDAFGTHACPRRVSQSGQVCALKRPHSQTSLGTKRVCSSQSLIFHNLTSPNCLSNVLKN